MDTTCAVVITSLLGCGCFVGFCFNCICSNEPPNTMKPIIEHVIITREHYNKLNKKNTSELPKYTESVDCTEPLIS